MPHSARSVRLSLSQRGGQTRGETDQWIWEMFTHYMGKSMCRIGEALFWGEFFFLFFCWSGWGWLLVWIKAKTDKTRSCGAIQGSIWAVIFDFSLGKAFLLYPRGGIGLCIGIVGSWDRGICCGKGLRDRLFSDKRQLAWSPYDKHLYCMI